MLADAIGNYVDSLSEREFDGPFIALLRLHRFTDIHFLHGQFEFGKDFIAKRVDEGTQCQYVFQTKAGDIGLSEWSGCRGQIDMLRTNVLAHPNFDRKLARRAVFVTTGRLVGGAGLAAQEYRGHLDALGEAQFRVWDRDTIIELLAIDPSPLGSLTPAVLQVLGAQHNLLNFVMLEKHSRTWIRGDRSALSLRDTLEAAVIAQHCRLQNRIDLACYTSLMLVRSLWATAHGIKPLPETLQAAIVTAKKIFRHYALDLWDTCVGQYLEPDSMVREGRMPEAFVAYPVRCLAAAEILGMLALLERGESPAVSAKIADYLSKFIVANAGASHPISDRWGVSVGCCVLALACHGRTHDLNFYLQRVIKWVADHYDGGNAGLAGPHTTPEEETAYLLGPSFEHTNLRPRSESYTATQVLDLCSVLEDGELFNLARNEFLAVGICLPMLEVDDSLAQYRLDSDGQRYEPNMPFAESWHSSEGWKQSPHHKRGPASYYAETQGEAWDQMAISCVLRDRHFVQSWRRLVRPKG